MSDWRLQNRFDGATWAWTHLTGQQVCNFVSHRRLQPLARLRLYTCRLHQRIPKPQDLFQCRRATQSDKSYQQGVFTKIGTDAGGVDPGSRGRVKQNRELTPQAGRADANCSSSEEAASRPSTCPKTNGSHMASGSKKRDDSIAKP